MRRALHIALVGVAVVAVLVGCSVPVRGLASPAETRTPAPSTASSTHGPIPGGATQSCLVGDTCGDSGGPVVPAGLVCSPLPTAMSAFDEQARAMFPSGQVSTTGSSGAIGALTDLVIGVVDRCGYQVMVDVANQYPEPLYGWLRLTAVSALGEISALSDGLRCVDLATFGLGPKQAVDYWFLWGSPALMDADSNGIPCETVWPDVARYLPSYY